VNRAPATAKLNLALVVGPRGDDGLHEVTTALQRIDLGDRVAIEPAARLEVDGFRDDSLVRRALELLADTVAIGEPPWRARIWKRIPVAAGLGGGSSDAATALRLANATLEHPLPGSRLHELAAELGADVPFFLSAGPQLGEGDGTRLSALDLPQDYWILLVLPRDVRKRSTAEVYAAFDARGRDEGHAARKVALTKAISETKRASDLAALPPNDLCSSRLSEELRALGAFRADVTGAGPVVYALFSDRARAVAARRAMRRRGRTWLTIPAWYG
jgi:4-diphosphocytidyl-2-C-methyl-D-erythritol kinase